MSFSDLLKRGHEVEPESRTVEVSVAGELLALTITELPGLDWTSITSQHPPRLEVSLDRQYGYNVPKVCAAAAAANGVLMQGDERLEPVVDPKRKIDEWADFIGLLSGHDMNKVVDAVFALNEWLPQQRVTAAKKALKGSSKKS